MEVEPLVGVGVGLASFHTPTTPPPNQLTCRCLQYPVQHCQWHRHCHRLLLRAWSHHLMMRLRAKTAAMKLAPTSAPTSRLCRLRCRFPRPYTMLQRRAWNHRWRMQCISNALPAPSYSK